MDQSRSLIIHDAIGQCITILPSFNDLPIKVWKLVQFVHIMKLSLELKEEDQPWNCTLSNPSWIA